MDNKNISSRLDECLLSLRHLMNRDIWLQPSLMIFLSVILIVNINSAQANPLLDFVPNPKEQAKNNCEELRPYNFNQELNINVPNQFRISSFKTPPSKELLDLLKIITFRSSSVLIDEEITEFILTTDDYSHSSNLLKNFSSFILEADSLLTTNGEANQRGNILSIKFVKDHWPFKQLFIHYQTKHGIWNTITKFCQISLINSNENSSEPDSEEVLINLPKQWSIIKLTLELSKKPSTYVLGYEKPKLIESIRLITAKKP